MYLNTETAQLLVDERLRQAERDHLVNHAREPHRWRHRVGHGLILLGRAMAEERPTPTPTATSSRNQSELQGLSALP
jgi:hypothetical protein